MFVACSHPKSACRRGGRCLGPNRIARETRSWTSALWLQCHLTLKNNRIINQETDKLVINLMGHPVFRGGLSNWKKMSSEFISLNIRLTALSSPVSERRLQRPNRSLIGRRLQLDPVRSQHCGGLFLWRCHDVRGEHEQQQRRGHDHEQFEVVKYGHFTLFALSCRGKWWRCCAWLPTLLWFCFRKPYIWDWANARLYRFRLEGSYMAGR